MKSSKLIALACGGSLLAFALSALATESRESAGAWAERVQVIYLPQTKSVSREAVKVWDANPERNLEFVWEPAAGSGIGAGGAVSGEGKLTWRVRGSASYDPRTVYSVYVGQLVDGRMHGKGRLEVRTGERYDGDWVAGVADGKGVRVDADGNRYEGDFRAGEPNGRGRLLSRNGEIFEGNFVDGRREGTGRTRLAGGTEYESQWRNGIEIGGTRPDALADASVGGLLRAQSGGGAAGKVEISSTIDDRMNQQAAMQYQHLVENEAVSIFPLDDAINEVWNGTSEIGESNYAFSGIDFEDAPAFVEVEVKTTDGTRVELKKLELQVANSETYRKPMLTLQRHFGCVGFRPTMGFTNNGWGGAKDATLNFTFGTEEEGGPQSRKFSVPVGSFDEGTDIDLKGAFKEAGVNTDALEKERFKCQSMDAMNVCRSQVFNKVGFGEIADYVWGEDKLSTTIRGTVDYTWDDDGGASHTASEPFRNDVSLAVIELPEVLAECGDGFGGSPEALRYQRIDLPLGKRDYVVDLPVRGNNKISQYEARLKMYAEKSSFHQFQPVAKFADGSELRGKAVNLFYFKPRLVGFESKARPAACYLPPEIEGC